MDSNISSIPSYFTQLHQTVSRANLDLVTKIADRLFEAHREGRRVFVFGNGGSAASASHFVCDLGKGLPANASGRRLRVMSLVDNVPLMTAWSNDVAYEAVFVEQLRNFAERGDVLFAISGSGNSSNVIKALEFGASLGTENLGLAGFEGGRLKPLCNHCFVAPSTNMQIIEDMHTACMHAIATILFSWITKESDTKAMSAVGGSLR